MIGDKNLKYGEKFRDGELNPDHHGDSVVY